MKRFLSVLLMMVLVIQLTACGLNTEGKNVGTLHLKNLFDNSVIEIMVDSEKVYSSEGETLAFQSNLNTTEMAEALSQLNPDYGFSALDDRQILMTEMNSNNNRPFTLFTKCVLDENENPIDDVYVVRNESCYANQPQHKMVICFPYHLTNNYFSFSQEDEGTYSLTGNFHEPFYNLTKLRTTTHTFTDLVEFYENYGGYKVAYEGGNLC